MCSSLPVALCYVHCPWPESALKILQHWACIDKQMCLAMAAMPSSLEEIWIDTQRPLESPAWQD
jgi:hypothetical protein